MILCACICTAKRYRHEAKSPVVLRFVHMAQFLHSLNKQHGLGIPVFQANGMLVSLIFSMHKMDPHVPSV